MASLIRSLRRGRGECFIAGSLCPSRQARRSAVASRPYFRGNARRAVSLVAPISRPLISAGSIQASNFATRLAPISSLCRPATWVLVLKRARSASRSSRSSASVVRRPFGGEAGAPLERGDGFLGALPKRLSRRSAPATGGACRRRTQAQQQVKQNLVPAWYPQLLVTKATRREKGSILRGFFYSGGGGGIAGERFGSNSDLIVPIESASNFAPRPASDMPAKRSPEGAGGSVGTHQYRVANGRP